MSLAAIKNAEMKWRNGLDAQAREALAALSETFATNLKLGIAGAELLGEMGNLTEAIAAAHRLAASFPASPAPHEALIGLYQLIGDLDLQLDSFKAAVKRGLKPNPPMLRQMLSAARMTARLAEFEALLDPEDKTAPLNGLRNQLARFQAEDQRFLERFRAESKRKAPGLVDVKRAMDAQQNPYASFLMTAASGAPTTTDDEISQIGRVGVRLPNGPALKSMIRWRARRRFPNSIRAWLDVAYRVLVTVGDIAGACDSLKEILALPDSELAPQADEVMRLATACASFGQLEAAEMMRIIARLFPHTRSHDLALLAAGFATRAAAAAVEPPKGARSRPRIAICVSGQLRSFRKTWPLTAALLADLDATVFVSTWHKTGAGFGALNTVGRRLPPGLRERLPDALQTRNLFAERYPTTYALMDTSDAISAAECSAFFGTPHVAVHDEDAFDRAHANTPGLHRTGNLNQAKMYFGIHDVMAMRRRHEAERGVPFDVVIRMRPDHSLAKLGIQDLRTAMRERVALSLTVKAQAVGDTFLVMNPDVADIVGGIWPAAEKGGSFNIAPAASGLAGEPLLWLQLFWNGVPVSSVRASATSGLGSVALPADELWQALARDLAALDELTADDLRVATEFLTEAGGPPVASVAALSALLASPGEAFGGQRKRA